MERAQRDWFHMAVPALNSRICPPMPRAHLCDNKCNYRVLTKNNSWWLFQNAAAHFQSPCRLHVPTIPPSVHFNGVPGGRSEILDPTIICATDSKICVTQWCNCCRRSVRRDCSCLLYQRAFSATSKSTQHLVCAVKWRPKLLILLLPVAWMHWTLKCKT